MNAPRSARSPVVAIALDAMSPMLLEAWRGPRTQAPPPEERGHPDEVPAAFVQEKGKIDNFFWLGFRKDVKNIYALSDLAVLPSYYNEGGYPRALLEPMAFGKPVITTDLPQCRGPVEHGRNGYLIPPRDTRALKEAILRIFHDDRKRERMGEYSRIKIEREFDDRRVVKTILNNVGAI